MWEKSAVGKTIQLNSRTLLLLSQEHFDVIKMSPS